MKTDPASGERYLRLPVPDPQTVQRLAEGLLSLLGEHKAATLLSAKARLLQQRSAPEN
ncbi:MAG TPA: hypothetical protein PLC14_03500 [Accumulibacter sp.]|uniref:hypothetical protein n=1 Tax=Accumulibacter sp. TaxID=2053492 RepID=UPI0004B346D0|nr:hypothetical protein [Accumulibacter sp.]HRE69586.1 hypothetical protein [Accumulibacter sp.]